MNRYYGEVAKPKNPAALSILAYRIGSWPATSINSTVSEQHSPPNGDKRPDLKRNECTNRPTTTTAAARKSTKNKKKTKELKFSVTTCKLKIENNCLLKCESAPLLFPFCFLFQINEILFL